MSHVDVTKDELRKQTWAHDKRAIAEATRLFREDPAANFSVYVTTMYSFREVPECGSRLIEQRETLGRRVEELIDRPLEPDFQKWADRLDTFSTHLYWIARQSGFGIVEAYHFLCIVRTAVVTGLTHANMESLGGHTVALLRLTYASILLDEDEREFAMGSLESAYKRGKLIKDKNQKRRVFKKTTALAWRAKMPLLACKAAVRWLLCKAG